MPYSYSLKLSLPKNNYYNIFEIISAHGGQARLVGGIVRDALLGLDSSDIDIATNLPPIETTRIFESVGAKVIPTGISYGTVTVVFQDDVFEITTLRQDTSTDGRHAVVSYTDDFMLDAQRRDFTINALSYDPITQTLYDYFNGYEDLKNRIVRFIGNPEERICEDHLRILRFFRFSAKYANSLDEASLAAAVKYKTFLAKLSKERIKSEMDKLIVTKNSLEVLSALNEHQFMKYIFDVDNFDVKLLRQAATVAKLINANLNANTIYAIMFMDSNLDQSKLSSFKFSNQESRFILDLLQTANHNSLEGVKIFLTEKWLTNNNYLQYFIIATILYGDQSTLLSYLHSLNDDKPIFPINASHLQKLGLQGSAIGQSLKRLKVLWIKENFSLSADELLSTLTI